MEELDQNRERIQDDLRGLIGGDVRCDDLYLQLYASDASIYEIRPLGVVRPRTAADVATCAQYAYEKKIPLHARGAGSGVVGQAIGPGLIVDFSTYLRRTIHIGPESVRIQPGLACERLNGQLCRQGRSFGLDPATSDVTTIGGMIGVDAAGSRWLKYGSVRRHVLSLQVVLADGHLLELGREPLIEGASTEEDPLKRDLLNRVATLLRQHADLIRLAQPKCPLGQCGYNLADVITDSYLDMPRLLTGSEGTLALVTEATLATQPLPRHRAVAVLMFDSLEKASRAVLEILPWHPSACDLMDRRHVSMARQYEPRFDPLIPAETEAALLIEQEGDQPAELRDGLERLVDELWHHKHLAFGARLAFEPADTALFWRLAAKEQPAVHRTKGRNRPVPVVEDVAVAPEVLPDFLVRAQNVLKRHQITASLFCHAGQGQLHLQPFLDLSDPGEVRRMQQLAADLYQEVFDVGGTISGAHGCGLSRTPFVPRQVGPLYDVFRQLKAIFDPANILNPGKVIGDDPDLLTRNLRPVIVIPTPAAEPPAEPPPEAEPSPEMRDLVELQLNWDASRVVDAAADCNRCGDCRTQSPGMRMCPVFRFAPREEASPRAKAALIHGILTGTVPLGRLTGEECKAIADLCIHCHMCPRECPVKVDIPRLMREAKAAYVAANGLRPSDWVMTRLDMLSAMASVVRPVTNWVVGNRQMRWLLEKTLGIAHARKLPRIAARSFLRRAMRRRLTRPPRRPGEKIVYFVDVFANYYDPALGEALVAVMEHNGVAVYVHPEQEQSGMPSIACGAIDHARRIARHNVSILAECVRQGYTVVATEPSAALALVREYPELVDDDDARLVAEHTSEACSYLWKLHGLGKLQLDFQPIDAALGYHLPCHLLALGVGSPGESLLGLVPGLRVQRIDDGCSGMGGTFGLKRENFRSSLRAGWRLISHLRDPQIQAGTTECSACKLQMEQGTRKPTIHPIKLLALSYGLMPELAKLLSASSEELIAT